MLEQQNFEDYIENNNTDGVVINIFYLDKCKPMKKYIEMLELIRFDIVYLYSLDKNPKFIDLFSIKGSPATLIYKENRLIHQFMGVPKYSYLEDIRKKYY